MRLSINAIAGQRITGDAVVVLAKAAQWRD